MKRKEENFCRSLCVYITARVIKKEAKGKLKVTEPRRQGSPKVPKTSGTRTATSERGRSHFTSLGRECKTAQKNKKEMKRPRDDGVSVEGKRAIEVGLLNNSWQPPLASRADLPRAIASRLEIHLSRIPRDRRRGFQTFAYRRKPCREPRRG